MARVPVRHIIGVIFLQVFAVVRALDIVELIVMIDILSQFELDRVVTLIKQKNKNVQGNQRQRNQRRVRPVGLVLYRNN